MKARTLAMAVAVVAVLLTSSACSKPSGGEPAEPDAASPSATSTPPTAEPVEAGQTPPATPAAMGQSAQSADWTIKVKAVDRVQAAGGAKASAGNELVVVTIELANGASSDQGTGPAYFKLTDQAGTEFQEAITSDPEFIFNIPLPIAAGETREIRIAYDVATGAGPLSLTFDPFVEGGNPAPAVLQVK